MRPTVRPKNSSPRGQLTRERIVDVALKFIARNGARGTSLSGIASEAGVSQAGLLYHFGTKEKLLNAVLDRHESYNEAWMWASGPDPGLKIFPIIADHVAGWPSQPQDAGLYHLVGMHTVMVAENVGDEAELHPRLMSGYRITIDRIRATLRAAQQRGEMRDDVDPELKAMEIIAFVNGLSTAWLLNPAIPARETAAQWASEQSRLLAASLDDKGGD